MESWEYRQLYKEHVKDYIRIFTKAGWDLDGDEEIEQIILDFRPLFENGATFHYFDYNNRMLALFLHGVVYGLQLKEKAAVTANNSRQEAQTSPQKSPTV